MAALAAEFCSSLSLGILGAHKSPKSKQGKLPLAFSNSAAPEESFKFRGAGSVCRADQELFAHEHAYWSLIGSALTILSSFALSDDVAAKVF